MLGFWVGALLPSLAATLLTRRILKRAVPSAAAGCALLVLVAGIAEGGVNWQRALAMLLAGAFWAVVFGWRDARSVRQDSAA